MIKNAGAAILAVVLGACASAAKPPPGYQGVVAYEERVVAFEVPGRITEVKVKRGDAVSPGGVLATLDDKMERLARDERMSEVDVAKADLAVLEASARREDIAALAQQAQAARAVEDNASKSAERARNLVASGSLPAAELDRAEAELRRATSERKSLDARLVSLEKGARQVEIARAKARVSASESAVSLEDERLARHTVKSLVGGVVLDVHVEPGELAAAGTPAATIADTSHPYVDVFVPQGSLEGVKVGRRAAVRVDAGDGSLPGVVEWISPKTEFTPRFLFSERERPNLVVRIRVRVDDKEARLHSGVPAFVALE